MNALNKLFNCISCKIMLFSDELQLPITVDEYIKEVKNQQKIVFPDAQLLPGRHNSSRQPNVLRK